MARFLLSKDLRPAAIYRGPLKRQEETAELIADPFQIVPQIAPVLSEIDYGPWEGLTAEAIAAKWPEAYALWTGRGVWPERIFGGAPPVKSLENWLRQLAETHRPGDTVLAVSSNGLIRYFYSFAKEAWNCLAETDQMETIKVKTGHFCDLLLIDGRVEVKSWNQKPIL